jgi:hypothetical protein
MKFTNEQAQYLLRIIEKWQEANFANYLNAPSTALIDKAIHQLKFVIKEVITKDEKEVISLD